MVDPLNYRGMVHVKDLLLVMRKSNPSSGGKGFPLLVLYRSLCLMPNNRKIKFVECIIK